jgi:hypothetical protein
MFNVGGVNIKDFSVRDVCLKNGREFVDYAKSRGAKSRSLCLKTTRKEASLAKQQEDSKTCKKYDLKFK